MVQVLKQSIQSLFLRACYNATEIGTATGFVYSRGSDQFLITNRHVVTGRHQVTGEPLSKKAAIPNELRILHNRKNQGQQLAWIERSEKLLASDESPIWYEHPLYKEKMDCVALKLTDLTDVAIYSYNEYDKAPSLLVAPAELVSVVGFPFGLRAGPGLGIATWATGYIASEPAVDYGNLPLLLIDCRARSGQSGSPVIAYRNGQATMQNGNTSFFGGPITRPIGVYSGRVNEESDLGMVWKMEAVRELVAACP